MNTKLLFTQALGDIGPWEVQSIEFKPDGTGSLKLHITLDFPRGCEFPDETGAACKAHDTKEFTWRHLNFFQHEAYLHARVPRIRVSDGSVQTVTVPWARRNGGFTMLFEAYVMELIKFEMTPSAVAALVGESANRIWYLFNSIVEQEGLVNNDDSGIRQVGIDETSSKKGHNYITIGVDMEENRVFKIVPGKDSSTVEEIAIHLKEANNDPELITDVCIDMSPAFIKGAKEQFPNANITFDRFHVAQVVNKAMNKVRIQERKEFKELKGHKYTVLKNPKNLSDKKLAELTNLVELYPILGEAYRLKELFRELWNFTSTKAATKFLEDWLDEVESSQIEAFQQAAKTIKNHKYGILKGIKSQLNSGIIEGINSRIQLAKKRARGFRNFRYFRNMIFFLCGKLKFNYPYIFS